MYDSYEYVTFEEGGVMFMLDFAIKSSVVRSHFSEVLDSVVRKAPTLVTRRHDHVMFMNLDHLSVIVRDLKLHAIVETDECGEYIASLDEIGDLYATGESEHESLYNLAQELVEYSQEYMNEDNFSMYFNSPNRKSHFPYVLKVLMQNSESDVLRFISVEHQRA